MRTPRHITACTHSTSAFSTFAPPIRCLRHASRGGDELQRRKILAIAMSTHRQRLRHRTNQNATRRCSNIVQHRKGYPCRLNRKICAALVTYRHSDGQHLKKRGAAHSKMKELLKIFWPSHRCHTRAHVRNLCADSECCVLACDPCECWRGRTRGVARRSLNQFRCENFDVMYFFNRSRRPAVLSIRAVEERGRASKPVTGCRLAALSQR